MRLEVDWDRCEGHGRCAQTAPEMFQLDGYGDLRLRYEQAGTDGVPAELEAKVAAAVRACPVTALRARP